MTESTAQTELFYSLVNFFKIQKPHVSGGLTTTPKKIMFYLLLFPLTVLYFVWLLSEAD